MDVNMGVLIPKENRHVEENAGLTAGRCEHSVDPLLGSREKTIELIPASC